VTPIRKRFRVAVPAYIYVNVDATTRQEASDRALNAINRATDDCDGLNLALSLGDDPVTCAGRVYLNGDRKPHIVDSYPLGL
jgi:hypothetical protein